MAVDAVEAVLERRQGSFSVAGRKRCGFSLAVAMWFFFNLNRLKLVLVSTGCNRRVKRICPSPLHVYRTDSSKLLGSIRSGWRQSNVSSKLDPLQRHLSARKSNRLSKAGTRLKGRSFVQYPDSTSHRRGRRWTSHILCQSTCEIIMGVEFLMVLTTSFQRFQLYTSKWSCISIVLCFPLSSCGKTTTTMICITSCIPGP